MAFVEESVMLLKNRKYKITNPRMAVLDVLAKANCPLSAYDIQGLIPKNLKVNAVTIYRILDIFQELGIAHRIHTREGYVRCDFELSPGCHFFAVCDQCGRASEFLHKDPCLLKSIVPKNLPFTNLKHITEVSGTCQPCSLSVSINS